MDSDCRGDMTFCMRIIIHVHCLLARMSYACMNFFLERAYVHVADGSFECSCPEGYLNLTAHKSMYGARADEFKKDYETKVCIEQNEW
jgi:hypothetical protein